MHACAAVQINPLPKLPVPLGIGRMIARFLSMRAGVSDLFIRGRLRITLKPLMSQLPVVGAVKVCDSQGSVVGSLVADPVRCEVNEVEWAGWIAGISSCNACQMGLHFFTVPFLVIA